MVEICAYTWMNTNNEINLNSFENTIIQYQINSKQGIFQVKWVGLFFGN